MKKLPFTREELSKKLAYNKETGEFTWIKTGKKAGSLSSNYSNRNKPYYCINIQVGGRKYRATRLAWLLSYGIDVFDINPKLVLDHKNNIATDNSLENIQLVTVSVNNAKAVRTPRKK